MSLMASQITGVSIVYSTVSSGTDQVKKDLKLHVTGLCEGNSPVGPVSSAHKDWINRLIIKFTPDSETRDQ